MSDEKWTCSECTYKNWKASFKCVLCNNDKNTNLLNQEIYNLNITQERHTSNTSLQNQGNVENKVKWPCSACTYLNWPKARKCIQCNTIRSKHSSPTLSQNSSSDEQGVLRKKSKDTSPEQINKIEDIKATSSDHILLSDNVNQTAESFNLSKAFQKWNCHFCTYENWPKSKICVMCQTPKFKSPSDNVISRPEPVPVETAVVESHPPRSSKKNNSDRHSIDMLWLEACTSVLNGNLYAFESYMLAMDGKLDRELTIQECRILNQPEIFKPGLTLLNLACKLGRNDFLELYLSTFQQHGPGPGQQQQGQQQQSQQQQHQAIVIPHRMPCHASPQSAMIIQAHLCETLRMRKGDFPCYVVHEHSTFWLPAEIELLPLLSRCRLFEQLVDKNVMHELEVTEKVINWWVHSSAQNRLTALWNRTAGDCLLDSVLQASWAILDRDNVLRTALADSIREAQHLFYPRWRQYEHSQARAFNYSINEFQYQRDWQNLLQIACQQGEPLEHVHIFVLCHILRRPIIVYGVKYINNHRNEPIGLAHFQGVYLPLLWDKSYCSRNPIVLGYTRGHFSALVPAETLLNPSNAAASALSVVLRGRESPRRHTPVLVGGPSALMGAGCGLGSGSGAGVSSGSSASAAPGGTTLLGDYCGSGAGAGYMDAASLPHQTHSSVCLLPLYDCNKQLLPIHFITDQESQHSETLLRDWLDVAITRRGFLMARMRSNRRHPLVTDLVEVWLEQYRQSEENDDDEEEEDEDDDEDDDEEEEEADEDDNGIGSASQGATSADYGVTLEPSTSGGHIVEPSSSVNQQNRCSSPSTNQQDSPRLSSDNQQDSPMLSSAIQQDIPRLSSVSQQDSPRSSPTKQS